MEEFGKEFGEEKIRKFYGGGEGGYLLIQDDKQEREIGGGERDMAFGPKYIFLRYKNICCRTDCL